MLFLLLFFGRSVNEFTTEGVNWIDDDQTLAFGDQVHRVTFFVLLNDNFVGLAQHHLHPIDDGQDQLFFSLRNHSFRQLSATLFNHIHNGCLELKVFLDGAHEDFHGDFFGEGRTNDFKEAF